jgi:citrate synthase
MRVEQEFGASPTLQWTLTRLFFYLGLEFELLTPLACLARLPGWCAHYCEQQGAEFRVQSEYSGTIRTLNRS